MQSSFFGQPNLGLLHQKGAPLPTNKLIILQACDINLTALCGYQT